MGIYRIGKREKGTDNAVAAKVIIDIWVTDYLLATYTCPVITVCLCACDSLRYISQGNYATRNSNGMCYLMSLRYLPEWREEDERVFVHRGSWIPNKGLNSTMPATVNCIYKKSRMKTLKSSLADSVAGA